MTYQNPEMARLHRQILSDYYKAHGVASGEAPSEALVEAANAHAHELEKNDPAFSFPPYGIKFVQASNEQLIALYGPGDLPTS
ncbi:hypothetical protein Rfer_4439 (plasmid) [Rhodoferax ferrireducens T118]|uniref:Uncharacterized protein n=1 Tax=Albidiferax ferrireducens (strain ATCC BAA-621 / DSM 15236 / T118) TaxID=338969 RepID=Q21Q20_ALBFT|nr:hypothetical protein [Rhodoferax ferrireducens]ABD72125.1 hypothetical protein Rfer_4439 [Rhodoferax ferrireducens T118]